MKIKQLKVSSYKNLKNIDLIFNSQLITLLVGQNGLGKSNLLEILATIFSNLDLLETEQELNDWPYEKSGFEYDILYECKNHEIRINSMEGMFKIYRKEIESKDDFALVTFQSFKRKKEEFLPKYIIGYYSGENKRLKLILKKHEDIQLNILKNWNKQDQKSEEQGLRRILFTENFHSQILLMTLFLYSNEEKYKVRIEDLVENYLQIEDINEFDIRFNNPDWNYDKIEGVNKGADYLMSNISSKEEVKNPFWNVKGKVGKLLTRFYNHQIGNGTEPRIYPNDDGDDERRFVTEFIEFSKINFKIFIEDLKEFFPSPVNFFDALEASNVLEIFNRVNLKIKKRNVEEHLSYTSLSEGEQQLITALSLVIIFGEHDCLFLFDEPDTHLNPKWQRDYVSLLKKFNSNDDNSHIIVATHSPLIVQAAEEADIFLYKRDTEGNITVENNNDLKIHNWRIDQVLASEYFEFESTRPSNLDPFMEARLEIIKKGKLDDEDFVSLKKLENEFGYLPTGETILDIESLAFLNDLKRK